MPIIDREAKRGMNLGWSTTPTVLVVAFSGTRSGFPPSMPLYWNDGLCGVMKPIGLVIPARLSWSMQP